MRSENRGVQNTMGIGRVCGHTEIRGSQTYRNECMGTRESGVYEHTRIGAWKHRNQGFMDTGVSGCVNRGKSEFVDTGS